MRLPPNFRLRCAVLDLVDGPRAGRIEVRGRRSIAGVLRTEPRGTKADSLSVVLTSRGAAAHEAAAEFPVEVCGAGFGRWTSGRPH